MTHLQLGASFTKDQGMNHRFTQIYRDYQDLYSGLCDSGPSFGLLCDCRDSDDLSDVRQKRLRHRIPQLTGNIHPLLHHAVSFFPNRALRLALGDTL